MEVDHRPCVTCRKPFPTYRASNKNCIDCRAKNRVKARQAKERKKMRDEMWRKSALEREKLMKMVDRSIVEEEDGDETEVDDDGETDEMDMLEVVNSLDDHVRSSPRAPAAGTSNGRLGLVQMPKPKKRKMEVVRSPKLLRDLEGQDQREALKVIKDGLLYALSDLKMVGKLDLAASKEGKEYQSASMLYDSLKRRVSSSSSSFLQYHGFHSIVAVSTIDHRKRVELVAKDIRKIARVSFQHNKPEATHNFVTGGESHVYRCTCLGYEPAPTAASSSSSSSASAPVKMKGSHGDLMRQARALEKEKEREREQAKVKARLSLGSGSGSGLLDGFLTVPRNCGGTVKIAVEDDLRHRLVKGQRISVIIRHPTGSK
ncbi:hypothetical protein D9613_009042 [Agrocybe pediades]|uniref:Uncharacterized protein n=1 Tax=Agrocybe pediades TaxID=84607 RepID=A0A8H4R4A4_9AGAR|nr:hypothetical protein D9613_009042 [Agrocybe pediades]